MENKLMLQTSTKTLQENVELSNNFLSEKTQYIDVLNDSISAYKGLLDLIPFELTDLTSGKNFPFFEGDIELSATITLAMQGYYRVSFSTLRNILELSLITIYFDLNDKASEEIEDWVRSREDTPFFSPLIKKIFQHENFKDFQDLKEITKNTFWELSNYNHTKGLKYSNRRLGSTQYIGTLKFNEKSLEAIFRKTQETVALCLALYSIKYPIAFLEVPLFKKFGFNRPMGYFLDADKADLWKKLIMPDLVKRIQTFAEANPKAIEMQNDILKMPDISKSEVEDQYFNMHTDAIMMQGFVMWSSSPYGKIFVEATDEDALDDVERKKTLRKRWENWSKEHSCYDRPLAVEEICALKTK